MRKILSLFIFIVFLAFQQVACAFVQPTDPLDETKRADAFEDNNQELKKTAIDNSGLSPIEKLYNGSDTIAAGALLKQIGYNFSGGGAASSSGKFDDSYRLNVGERVKVNMYGESVDVVKLSGSDLLTPSATVEVDTKGNIFIPGLGSFPAEGRTIGQVESAANSVASSKFESLTVKIAMESGTQIPVFVYGKVGHSGKILVGSNSTVYDVLCAAGGVGKSGTLRNIQYTTGGRTRTIDLYSLFFNASGSVPFVKANDKIYVPGIGDTVAIRNGVMTPGIYEIKKGETAQSAVRYAGGFLTGTTTENVVLTGLDKTTNQRTAKNMSWDTVKVMSLKSGDSLQFGESYNTAENTVTIQGNIKHPTTYAYKDGMRLSDILKDESELLEETFISQASIRRISGDGNTVETISVYLKEFFAGMNDPVLQPRDVVTIYKNTTSGFVDVYGCVNKPQHLVYMPGMVLSDVMTDLKFVESEPSVEQSMEQNQINEGEEALRKEFPVAYQVSVEENAANTVASDERNLVYKTIPIENIAVEIISKNDNSNLYYLYDIMINSNKIKTIPVSPEDRIFFRKLRDNEVLKTVKVSGHVKNPGVYTFIEGKHLKDMLNMAGGLTNDAQLEGIVLTRPQVQGRQIKFAKESAERDINLMQGRISSGYLQTGASISQKEEIISQLREDKREAASKYNGQIALNIKSNNLSEMNDADNILVQDGDDIYIPKIADYVSVIGEVYNEQTFAYQKGKKAKHYIKQVGGYTPNANKFRLYKVGVNGRAVKIGGGAKIAQGDVIIVPRKVAGNDWLQPITNILQSCMNIFLMAFAIKKW